MNSKALVYLIAILALPVLAAPPQQLYRYKDDNGIVVLERFIPADKVSRGYEILNEKGRILKVVPPALTKAQIAKRNAAKAEKLRQQALREKRIKQDKALLKLYGHPNDAVRILRRKVQDIDDVIKLKRSNITSVHSQQLIAEKRAADRQRNGLKIPDTLLNQIEGFKKEILNSETDIAQLQQKRIDTIKEFESVIERLEKLTKQKATDHSDILKSLKATSADHS